ncbi:hypothetical protein SOCE26_020670 [Sorangium cellulosum]|uniref:Uncharacterized protein n=1 Tax=Sorangium cellulosum TaxID=56 RepID=A0A2L0EMZ5_SORCE|nr:DUF1552 domain-containing protein [Sorangium cellulosum]AUX40666.1 hypothetical protein SOCE26_020670 [Sorangium cellulosum]
MKISRRALLRGAGVAVALPFLDVMRPQRASAAPADPKRFVAFFVPNGTDPGAWHPRSEGPLSADNLTPCLVDMKGFAAEREWPAGDAIWQDVTMVSGVDHQAICSDIHSPAMSLCAHTDGGGQAVPRKATLDQVLADHIASETPYRSLNLSPTGDTAVTQGFISFRDGGQVEDAFRDPAAVFDTLFSGMSNPSEQMTDIRRRRASVLDWVREDAKRLNQRLGAADRARVEQHLESVFELERQIQSTTASSCAIPDAPPRGLELHGKFKQMIDLGVLALTCDLTRVLILQYSNSWDLSFAGYDLPDGVGDWSDHFISHKLGDRDRATDLDGLPQAEASRIANARVVQTSRFKVRRFAYLLNAMKAASTPTGNLLDESLVLYTSENGDGDSHGRANMPYMLAGHVGGFKTGRAVKSSSAPTGALHCSIINYFGIEMSEYGDPKSGPIPGL